MSHLNAISDDTFEAEVVESKVPVLVDLGKWCGHAKQFTYFRSLAQKYGEKLNCKLDVDANPGPRQSLACGYTNYSF